MRKFKKVLAFALAAAMILTAAPVAPAQAAAAPVMNYKTKTIYVNGSKTYNNVDLGVKNASTKTYSRKFTTTTAGKNVVSVDATSGVVKAKKAGTATITATLTNKKTKKVYKKVTSKITVKTATKTLKVSNKDIPATLNVGGTYDFNSSVDKGASTSRTWSSSDKAVATINSKDGVVTAVGAGKVTLTVKEKYSGKTAKVTLEVLADAPVATQTGVKAITITNGVSMSDKTVTLKKDKTTITLAAKDGVTFSTDGKTAIITTAGKLTAGTYTVAVGDKSLEVPVTDEKVSKILILSEKAAVKSQTITSEASATYKVENQFGEDITKTTTVRITGSYVSDESGSGKIKFENKNNFIINRDVVNVSVMHPETGVSATATLTISDAPVISEVKYEGIYNVDNKTLTEDATIEDFYLLFSAKDQYGQKYKDYKDVEIGKDMYVTLNGGLTNLGIEAKATGTMAKKITKDGVDYLAVQLAKIGGDDVKLSAGTAQVYVIAPGLTANVTENIVVEAGSKVTKLTVHAPSYVVAGEETEIEYTAIDGNGNEVTAYNSFKNIEINTGSIGTLKFKKDADTGKAKLVYNTNDNVSVAKDQSRTEMFTITIKSGTYQAVPVQLTVKENARPTEIIGTGDASTGTIVKGKIEIALEKLEIADQYGRIIKADDMMKVLKGYGVIVSADATSKVFDYTGTKTTKAVIGTDITTKGDKVIIATSKGEADTEKVTVTLLDKEGKTISGSAKEVELTAATADKISNVKVSVKKVYSEGGTDYKQKVEVTGTRNGAKVTLDKSLYQVNVGSSDLTTTSDPDAHYVEVTKEKSVAAFEKDKNLTEVTQKIEVVLLSGETVSQDVVISNVKPQVTKVEFGKSGSLKVTSGSGFDTAANMVNRSEIKITDTYEKEFKSNEVENGVTVDKVAAFATKHNIAYNFTFSNYTDDDKKTVVEMNGSNKAQIKVEGTTFKTCTLTISLGTFKKEIGVEL